MQLLQNNPVIFPEQWQIFIKKKEKQQKTNKTKQNCSQETFW